MRYVKVFLLLILGAVASAQARPIGQQQTPPPDTSATQQQIDKETPEEAFHNIMAETFHAMEEGDFQPIKIRAGELAQKATTWAEDEARKGSITPETKPLFARLVDGANDLAHAIDQRESDEQIEHELAMLHDLMHEIMEKRRN
ncbi:MAG: hypothetical protein HGB19_04415 [Chlorobiales bacterium]|jgi:hypothetical protein|nr:hypothetical protein [Chlorobiales bacterium]